MGSNRRNVLTLSTTEYKETTKKRQSKHYKMTNTPRQSDNLMPESLHTASANGSALNLDALYRIAPSCFTEIEERVTDPATGEVRTELRRAVDFAALRSLLGDCVAEAGDERYAFTWPGKEAARREAATPVTDTLRPVQEESLNWEQTENLYIEGDNLTVLKLLQRGYMGKVKMIYIDPPYNTGNDFVYNDDFTADRHEYAIESGAQDELGFRYRKNSDSNGRFHSDWCSMIYPRLMVARTLLAEDGVIFISIDDNEVHNLRKICDEVFGASNFVAQLPTIMNLKGNQDQFGFAGTHEYTLVYAKEYGGLQLSGLPIDEEECELEWSVDDKGFYKQGAGLISTGTNSPREHRPKLWFPIFIKEDKLIVPPDDVLDQLYDVRTKTFNDEFLYSYIDEQEKAGVGHAILPRVKGREASWRWSVGRIRNNPEEIIITKNNSGYTLYKKQRPEVGDLPSKKPKTLFYKPEYSSGNGTRELENLLQAERYFSNPKPLLLLCDFIQIGSDPDAIILDFFSGSATTAHAVMQLNAEDGGHRKYIMVQLPEETPEGSEARKAGYATIPAIAKERIRRAGAKIQAESPLNRQNLDTGFRVFRLDSTNYNDVFLHPSAYKQQDLDLFEENFKPDRTELDLLYGAMLAWGLPLSLPITTEKVDNCTIYTVDENGLVACFSPDVNEAVIRAMAACNPLRMLFRDSCFTEDTGKINLFEIVKQLLGWDQEEALRNIRVI